MYAFEYYRPTSVRQAASLLGKAEDAKVSVRNVRRRAKEELDRIVHGQHRDTPYCLR